MDNTESSALTRAICDRDIPRPLRAGMLREINNAGKGLGLGNKPIGLNFYYGAEIPLALQDSDLGRKWFCERRKPGYEDVRCSGLLFFEKSLNGDAEAFFDNYQGVGWVKANGTPISDWKAVARNWSRK